MTKNESEKDGDIAIGAPTEAEQLLDQIVRALEKGELAAHSVEFLTLTSRFSEREIVLLRLITPKNSRNFGARW